MNSFLVKDGNSTKSAFLITKISINEDYYIIYSVNDRSEYIIYASKLVTINGISNIETLDSNKSEIYNFIFTLSNSDITDELVLKTKKKFNIRLRSNNTNFRNIQIINQNDKLMTVSDNIFNKLFNYFDKLNRNMQILKNIKENKITQKEGFILSPSILIIISAIFTIFEYIVLLFIKS